MLEAAHRQAPSPPSLSANTQRDDGRDDDVGAPTDPAGAPRQVPCRLRVCGMHPAHRYTEDGEDLLCPGI